MPIFASIFSVVFTGIFTYLAKKLTMNLAIVASFVATTLAAWIALKSSFFGLSVLAGHVMPSALVQLFSMLLPPNMAIITASIWAGDAILTGWAYWRHQIEITYQLANA